MVEQLQDIIEDLADDLGIHGSHVVEHEDGQCECRVCWASQLNARIIAAVEIGHI